MTMLLASSGPLWCIQKASSNAANQVYIYGAQLVRANYAGRYSKTEGLKLDNGDMRNDANV